MVAFFGNRNAKKQQVAGKNRYFDRTYYVQTNNNPKWGTRNYENFAEEGYINNVIAHRSITMIANSVASIEPLFFEIDSNNEKVELAYDDEIVSLLKRPNPATNYINFMQQIVSNYLISGNAYIQAVRDDNNNHIVEMYVLRSDRVSIDAGYGNLPRGYKYSINNMIFNFDCDEDTGESDILHIKTFHPLDDWYGLSPMESAQYSIEQHNECLKWNKSLLENGARPCGALVVKQAIGDDTYKRLKNELDDKFKGSENSGKFLILEGGLEWKEMGISPKEMDFIETKNTSARDIATAFGVPSQLLGIKGDTTYNNVVEARMSFWEETVLPLAKTIMSSMSNWISTAYNKSIVIEPDLDSISSLADKRQKVWDTMNKSDFISDGEKRESLGFEKNDEGKNK